MGLISAMVIIPKIKAHNTMGSCNFVQRSLGIQHADCISNFKLIKSSQKNVAVRHGANKVR